MRRIEFLFLALIAFAAAIASAPPPPPGKLFAGTNSWVMTASDLTKFNEFDLSGTPVSP